MKIITNSKQADELSVVKVNQYASAKHCALSYLVHTNFFESAINELLATPTYSKNIQALDFQHKNALKVLQDFPNRVIIADEVGLGKTISTAMIIKELIFRKMIHKVIILVPSSLKFQWQEELRSKFAEEFVIANDPQDYENNNLIIASIDTAKTPKHQQAINKITWDLLVIDEVHKLKNPQTKNYKLVKSMTVKRTIGLSATPVQNNAFELWSLLNLLHPGFLGTKKVFEESFLADKQGLNLKNNVELKEKLKKILIRTLRKDTKIKFAKREISSHYLDYTTDEKRWQEEVFSFIKKRYNALQDLEQNALANLDLDEDTESSDLSEADLSKMAKDYKRRGLLTFSLIMLSRQMTSAKYTGIKALERYKLSLEEEKDIRMIDHLLDLGNKVGVDSKIERLLKVLKKIGKEKVVLFTSFLDTQKVLAMELSVAGYSVSLFNGTMNPKEKEKAIDEFRANKQILICTDAGSEGRNLQFSHIIVNYDLPWNPMRVEQRIGRVHRIGQTETVQVHNIAVKDTIEAYILDRLYSKLKLFELSIGEMDLVLSQIPQKASVEKTVFSSYLEHFGTEKKVPKQSMFVELEQARKKVEEVKAFDAMLFDTND